jgi:Flp pilus assembly protein TadD
VNNWRASALAALCALVCACGSSPTKDDAAETKVATSNSADPKSSAKQGDAPGATEPAPVGPPPIPPEATQQFERALTLLGAGDLAPAEIEFKRLSQLYPDYSGPMTNLGIVYLKSGKLADAEKTLKAATQRGEPSAAAFNQLGIVYRRLGKFKEADEAYTQAIKIDSNYALAHLNLGVLCDMYLGQPQRALEAFERYLQLTPNPDTRVPSWVKELQGRVGKAKPAAPAAQPAVPPTEAGV